MIVDQIAKMCHEVNRAYLKREFKTDTVNWDNADVRYKSRVVNYIVYLLENPEISREEAHDHMLKKNIEDGWRHDAMHNEDLKVSPQLLPYHDLSDSIKMQIDLSMAIIGCFKIAESPEELEEQTHPALRPPKMEEEK